MAGTAGITSNTTLPVNTFSLSPVTFIIFMLTLAVKIRLISNPWAGGG
jgi:hypothetical protein